MSLSKREIIMLVFLIIIAVFFIEYRFVVTPGIARYDSLTAEKQQVEDQVRTIQLNLAIAKQNEKKRDENLDQIKILARRYFGELQMDALLVRTHDLVLEEGFNPVQYQIQQIIANSLAPQSAEAFDMSYQLKSLANTYQILTGQKQEKPSDQAAPPAVAGDQVEQYQIGINARGTYDQIKSFLDAINSMQRSVVISSLIMVPDLTPPEPTPGPTEPGEVPAPTPTPTEPVEPAEPQEQLLTVNITLYYYGLIKLVPTTDTFNRWYREPFVPVEYTPFKQPPVPEVTEPVEPVE